MADRSGSSAPASKPPSHRRLAIALVAFCFGLGAVSRGLTESFTVFLLPLQQAFGWDRASVAAIYSLAMLTSGLAAPLAGFLFDRFGPFRLYLAGILVMTGGFSLAAFADALWHFYLCLGLGAGFAAAALGNVPHSALLSRWYTRRLATALSVVYASMGVGILLLTPLAQALIDRFGWRNAYLVLALLLALMLAPLLTVPWRRATAGRPAPPPESSAEPAPAAASWTLGRAVRTSAFWGLFCAFLFTSNGMFAIFVQGVAYLVEVGYPPLTAASAYGVIGVLAPVGMIGFAWADQIIGRLPSVTMTYVMTMIAIAALWPMQAGPSFPLLALFVGCLGLTFGSRGPLVSAIAARIFRGRSLGAIFGSIVMAGGIGGAVGSYTGGLLHDLTGGYDAVLAYALVSVALGLMPFLAIPAVRRG